MRAIADIVIGLTLSVLAVFTFLWAGTIQSFGDDPLGARALPRIVSGLIFILSFILFTNGIVAARSEKPKISEIRIPAGFLRIVMPLWALLFVYMILFVNLGYLLSTILISIPVLILFGNRNYFSILSISIISGIIYYIIFIKLFGMFDAPGRLFSLSTIF
jgi:putative tricarboxylic transport membrane protein